MKITKLHNRAFHKYLSIIAEELNNAGLSREQIIELVVDMRWTTETIKEALYRPILINTTTKESTKDLTDKELCEVEKLIDEALLKLGIEIDYPSIDTLMRADLDKQIDTFNQ